MPKRVKGKPSGPCALCLKERSYVKSHIISKFHSRKLHKGNENIIAFNEKGMAKTKPGGRWEYLLCEECDNDFGKDSEDYAAKVLYHAPQKIVCDIDSGFLYSGIDNEKFRAYLLFTLWRMSVSQLDFFSGIDLEPDDNETLRQALLDKTPLWGRFHVTLFRVLDDKGDVLKALVNPIMLKDDSGVPISVALLTNGFLHQFDLTGDDGCLSYNSWGADTITVANIHWWKIPWFQRSFSKAIDSGALDSLTRGQQNKAVDRNH